LNDRPKILDCICGHKMEPYSGMNLLPNILAASMPVGGELLN